MYMKWIFLAALTFLVLITPALYLLWSAILRGYAPGMWTSMISMVFFIAGCIIIGGSFDEMGKNR